MHKKAINLVRKKKFKFKKPFHIPPLQHKTMKNEESQEEKQENQNVLS